MKKRFLLLFMIRSLGVGLLFFICTNIQINAMEEARGEHFSTQAVTINGKVIPKEEGKKIIRRLIQKKRSLTKEKHRQSLCLITMYLINGQEPDQVSLEQIIEQITAQISREEIEKIRDTRVQSPRGFLASLGRFPIEIGNIILAWILEVLNEREE